MSLNDQAAPLRLWQGQPSIQTGLRSVSFDLDGTFADTSTDLAGALNALRLELGQAALPVPDVARHVGRGARWLVSHCLDQSSCRDLEPLVLRFLELYAGCCTETTAPYSGLVPLVEHLREAGVLVTLATNKPRRFTEAIVEGLSWGPRFDGVYCGDDGPSKPDPWMIEACMADLSTQAPQHLHVGDTVTDAHAAQNAGCFFAPCFWGMDQGEALRAMNPVGFKQPSGLVAAFQGV